MLKMQAIKYLPLVILLMPQPSLLQKENETFGEIIKNDSEKAREIELSSSSMDVYQQGKLGLYHVVRVSRMFLMSSLCYTIGHQCSDCNSLGQRLVCMMCCQPKTWREPMALSENEIQGGRSFISHQANQMMFGFMEFIGLRPIYQSYIQSREDNHRGDVISVINNFEWKRNKIIDVPVVNASLEARTVCGYYVRGEGKGRITGGTMVEYRGKFPWQLSLATGFFGFFYQHRCGASLLSKYWVMTAAHCMKVLSIETTYVMGGFIGLNERSTAQIRKVSQVFVHENFIPELYEQDIALLKLEEPMHYTGAVLPVCLPQSSQLDYINTIGTLTGWGRKWNDGPLAEELLQVKLPILSNKDCMDWYSRSGSNQYIPDYTFLCAGYETGELDACSGDSGGPLVSYRGDDRAEVVGIVSWGIGCGARERPGVYTRVTRFLDWIRTTVDANSESHEPM